MVMTRAIKVMEDLGAVIVRASMPAAGWIGGPGTTMAVLNRNPLSRTKGTPATPPIVFLYELKRDLNLYLKDWATNTGIKSIADIVAFNEANAGKALRFGQDLFLAANLTKGDLSELEYKSARAMDLLAAKTRGMDAYVSQHKLDAVLFPGAVGAAIAAKAGYPSVMVPGGFISGSPAAKDTPDYPLGITFAGLAWSERKLLRLAYAYEQASNMRKPPPGLPAL
jgi:amidase